MRFKKLTIENFGPFKDRETVDFPDRNGVIIVWGDNGRGKTSLLNAFNFAFFGLVKDRQRKTDNYIKFINEEGFNEGRCFFKVSLVITDDDCTYTITRNCVPKPGVKTPLTNEDLTIELFVNKNGMIVDSEAAEHIVNTLMPMEVSRFFLFDGELLQEYEDLLDNNSSSGIRIKKAIEQILGLPVLSNGSKDAAVVREKYEAAATKIEQNDSKTAKYGAHKERELANKHLHENELRKLEALLEQRLADKRSYEAEMLETEKLRSLSTRKKEIEAKIEALSTQFDSEIEEIVSLLRDAWRWMVKPTVTTQAASIQKSIQHLHEKQAAYAAQSSVLCLIKQAVSEEQCPVCEHHTSISERDALLEKIASIESGALGLSDEDRVALNSDNLRIACLQNLQLADDRSIELRKRCQAVDDLRVKLSDLRDNQLAEVSEALSTFRDDNGDPFKIVSELSQCENEISIISKGINAESEKIKECSDNIAALTKTIASLSQNKDIDMAHEAVRIADSIQAIFTEAIDQYREKLRREVESDATKLFLSMSTESDYDSLQINDNYGLTIMREGRPVPNRSAGWEHMVAFALIGALHKNAPLEGPVIMDSPFGRISTKNKSSMVKSIPLISDQVVLLALPGEIDEGKTRSDLGIKIVRERALTRVNALHSQITDLGVE